MPAAGCGGAQSACACKAGEFKCVDDAVYKCNDARSDFVKDPNLQSPCAAGLCNPQLGKCNVCVPGAVTCNGDSVETCSDDGQSRKSSLCAESTPRCTEGVCGECKVDSDPSKTGCAAGNDCVRADKALTCKPSAGTAPGMKVQFCHAGACKVTLEPGYDLDFKADWRGCTGSTSQQPYGAGTIGIMLWPTALTDLVIPLADSGWSCKLPPANGNTNGCVVNASQSVRDLYIWGPIETGCTYVWGNTASGIDAAAGPGCGMCMLTEHAADTSADYAFNLGFDTSCRCPKFHFAAVPAKKL